MATRSRQAPKSRPPTASDLALAHTRGEIPFSTPGLEWPDGSPMELTIRARNARQRQACNRAAIKAAAEWGGEFDEDVWSVETAWHGIVRPQLTEAQKSILWDLNGVVLDQIVDWICRVEQIPAGTIQTELERMANVSVPPAPEKKPARPRRPRVPVVADNPGVAPQSAVEPDTGTPG